MQRSSLARRYMPLAGFLAIQLLIVSLWPSRPMVDAQDVASGPLLAGDGTTYVDPETGQVIDPLTGEIISGGDGGPTTAGAGPSGGPAAPGAAGGPASGGGAGVVAGDTSHCVDGRQYDPRIYEYAPPCAPKFVGDNGGATYRGVTKDTIKLLVLRGNYGVAVETALSASGTLPSDADFNEFLQTAASFINQRYELYGRKLVVEMHKLRCGTGGQGPPDNECLRNEVRQLVQDKQPFAVQWQTSVSSETYVELSKLKVLNIGGYGFTDRFSETYAPYHWDLLMGGNQMVSHVSEWYCKRMHGQKAAYAGQAALQASDRRLGVLSTDDPDNKLLLAEFLKLIEQRCGIKSSDVRQYFYAQDATTADVQRREAVGRMKAPPAATTVMCFCDEVAPAFLYDEQELQDYYPENVFVSTGFTDLDSTVQTYDHLFDPQRPADQYPQMENAFGLAQMGKQQSRSAAGSGRIWKAMGKPGEPKYGSAHRDWDYMAMLGLMLQAAGPRLTPANVERGVQALPPIAPAGLRDDHLPQRGFQGDHTWNDTMREVYWSPRTKSEHNGRAGSWLSLNGGRWFRRGEHLSAPLTLPGKPR